MLLKRPLKIILMSLFVSFSAMSRADCDVTQFKKYISTGSMEVFECDNFTELEEKDLGYGRRALHWVILKRKTLSADFLRTFLERVKVWNVEDRNRESPVTYLLRTYRPSEVDEWILDRLLTNPQVLELFSDAIAEMGATRLLKISAEDFELKKKLYEKIWDNVSNKNEEYYGITPIAFDRVLYNILSAVFSSLIISDAAYADRNIQGVRDYFFDRFFDQVPDTMEKILISNMFTNAVRVDYFLEEKDRRYVSMLLHHEKIDKKWPQNINEQEEYFLNFVDAVLSIDSVEELKFLIENQSIPIRSGLSTDLFVSSIASNSRRCFGYLLGKYKHIFFKKDSHAISYLHKAAYSGTIDIFKHIVDAHVQGGFKNEARSVTVAGYTVMQALSEKIKDFPDDERYPEMLNYYVERIMRNP